MLLDFRDGGGGRDVPPADACQPHREHSPQQVHRSLNMGVAGAAPLTQPHGDRNLSHDQPAGRARGTRLAATSTPYRRACRNRFSIPAPTHARRFSEKLTASAATNASAVQRVKGSRVCSWSTTSSPRSTPALNTPEPRYSSTCRNAPGAVRRDRPNAEDTPKAKHGPTGGGRQGRTGNGSPADSSGR